MIIFTICSNNYLALAKTLGDSLIKHNPDYKFIIGLTDEFNDEIDYSFFEPFTIIPVEKIGVREFDDLWKKYSIVEFNTSVKASYFKYIFNTYSSVETICYLDPDIRTYHSLEILTDAFLNHDILLTPHILSPIQPDNYQPSENVFLNFGLYNLGFLGLSRNCVKNGFLDWWEKRILSAGFQDTLNGFFVDQLWINFVPLFYDKVKIFRDSGLNAAPWNLHERSIKEINGNEIKMMNDSPLYFYHFSAYSFKEPAKMSKYYDRYNFQTNPELELLYAEYHNTLIKNKIEILSMIPCAYLEKRKKYMESQIVVSKKKEIYKAKLKSQFKLFVPPVLLHLKRTLMKP